MDGGLCNLVPYVPAADYTIRVCCLPARELHKFPGLMQVSSRKLAKSQQACDMHVIS